QKIRLFFVPAEPKVAFVVRIRGVNQLHPDAIRILRLFRLRQIHNGTFFKINKASLNMLKKVLPFVTFGYPSRQTVSKLLLKRGFAKVNGQRIPITDNAFIEKELGKYNINCIEDLAHVITTCGPHFKEANNFLWPFKLDTPRGGFKNKRHAFHQGGDWGNREVFINHLVKAML
ncbi:hypothetical protein IMG5_035100, partial [Ichthyophthirius multifiliis]